MSLNSIVETSSASDAVLQKHGSHKYFLGVLLQQYLGRKLGIFHYFAT